MCTNTFSSLRSILFKAQEQIHGTAYSVVMLTPPALDHTAVDVVFVAVVFALFYFFFFYCVHFHLFLVETWIVRRQVISITMQNNKWMLKSWNQHAHTRSHRLTPTHALKGTWKSRIWAWWVGSPLCLQNLQHLFSAHFHTHTHIYTNTLINWHRRRVYDGTSSSKIHPNTSREKKIAWKFVSAERLLSLKWISLK